MRLLIALWTLTGATSFLLLTSGVFVVAFALGNPVTETHYPDLSGTWEIQEEDKTYHATLDTQGNGPYTHKGGRFTTTKLDGRLWSGKWAQTGNDREGEFEVLLSEDFLTAEGSWWYTRVGENLAIPPGLYGGSYFFRKLQENTTGQAQQPP